MATRQNQNQNQTEPPIMPPADLAAAMAAETPAERLMRLKAAKDAAIAANPSGASGASGASSVERKPIAWSDALTTACDALSPAFMLPTMLPSRGASHQGICKGRRCFAVAPADLSALNRPIPTEPVPQSNGVVRHEEMVELCRSFVFNSYYGAPLYVGASLADGGKVKLAELLQVLPLGERYANRKWCQTLWYGKSGDATNNSSLMFKLAQITGRYVILDTSDETLQLVRDFFPAKDTKPAS
jgi:hypothetical protein